MRAMQKALGPTALRRQWYITGSTWGDILGLHQRPRNSSHYHALGTSYFSNYFSNYFQQ